MADKYWWQEDDQKKQEQRIDGQGYWWDDGAVAAKVGNSIANRVNTWLQNHNNYVSNYKYRNEGRKYNYEDSYVRDSASWLDTVSLQKSNFDTEADSILSYMDQHKDYLDADWVKSVRDTLTGARGAQSQILDHATQDNKWWISFGSEDLVSQYGSAEDAYKYYQRSDGYSKKYTGKTYDELSKLIGDMDDGEEKEWLTSYASSVDYDEKGKLDLNKAAQEIEGLGNLYDQSYTIGLWYDDYKRGLSPYDAQKIEAYNRLMNEYGGDVKDLEKDIKRKEAYLKSATDIQNLNSLSAVSGNADFSDKSRYVSNVEYGPLGNPEFADDTYAYVNNPTVNDERPLGTGQTTARELIEFERSAYSWDTPTRNRDSSYERDAIDYIKPEEVKIYNYLYATEGAEKAREYLDLLVSTFQARKDAETVKNTAKFAGEHPILSSVLSVGTSLGSGFEYLEDIIVYGGDKLIGKDAKLGTNEAALITNAVRSTVSDKVDWEIGNWDAFDFVYNTAMSGADSLASTAFGGFGGAVLGLSAAAQGTNDALNRGMSDGQAFWNGLFSGVFEGLFESLSIGNFNKLKETALNVGLKNIDKTIIKTITKNIGKSMLVNASEEMLTELANIAYDTLVNGEFANYTLEELENGAWKSALNQVIESGASGALMGMGMSALGSSIGHAKGVKAANEYAVKNYGKQTDAIIQEGLENDVYSNSYKLATKYQKQVQGKDGEKGKTLTGQQIRNLLAANQEQITPKDLKKIQQAAEKRLTDLGQTEDVAKVAELATKRATGQRLTKAEKTFLANSEYGARVANELLPENILSGDYSTEWAEGIGTKKVNALAYNIKDILEEMSNMGNPATYKSLEDRVSKEDKFSVSESGKATISKTNEAIDLSKPEIVDFVRDKESGKVTDIILNVDGKQVKASEIDFADADQSYLFSAVKNIENITPGDATAFVRGYKPDSGQTVGEYLNGIDEAFTYGYHKYSESDMGAGLFTPKLSSEQAKGAYLLGQTTRAKSDTNKSEAIKRMRTAVEAETSNAVAEGKEAPKAKTMTITYNEGGGKIKDFDKAGIALTEKQGAGVEVAKILHKLGLGTNFEFFTSEESDTMTVTDTKTGKVKKARVFINDAGVEEIAPAGVYRKSDGTIRIDLNAYNGRELTLNALAHELTHFIQQWSDEKYKALADFLVKTYEKTDMTMHQRVLAEQARLKDIRGVDVSYNEAYDEVVAKAMMKMFNDGKLVERLTELKAQDKDLAQKLWEGFKKILAKFLGVYNSDDVLYKDSDDLVGMKEAFEQLQNMFAEALVEASENFQAAQSIGFELDMETESVSPAVMHSEHTWTESDYVQQRDKAAEEIAKAIGVSKKKAKDYIDSVNSIAKMIAEDRSRLDYFSSPGRSSFVDNAEYGGSFDFSTLCKKRRLLTGTFTAIQKALPNTALTADEILDIRNRMKKANIEVSCGLCYVEGSRANMGQFAKEFLRLYKQYYPDAWQPNMADVNTPDGIEWVRLNHPECYEQYEYFWNHYGTLKDGDKNLFASQQKPKLYQFHTEYKGEILNKFKNDDKVEDKNLNGGIRLQSFSDFEIVHLIDTMQIIMDMSRVGLAGQAYTKVPDFAWALGDTGLKINLSLIAKGVDANGKLIFDDVEGMPITEAMKLRDRYSKNVGTILVAFNDEQLLAAMADDRVDFIIPFHRSQWKKSQYEAMGLPAKTKDYTYMQNEKFIKPTFHEYRGRMVKDKATNYMPNEYWDFSKSGKENAEAYLEMCARNNKRPKFYKLLQNNGDGSYSLKADGSTDGYWKLLIDFKMYDNEGNGSPQMAVKPDFNMEEANRMLNDYSGGHSNFPVAQGIVDGFVKDYKASHKSVQYSSQETDYDDTLKSHLDLTQDIYYPKTGSEMSVFNRQYINKTNGLKSGKIRYITIYTGSNVYVVRACGTDGLNPYIGKILTVESLDSYYLNVARGALNNGFNQHRKGNDSTSDEIQYNRRRGNVSYRSVKERLEAEGNGHLLEDEPASNTDGDRGESGRDPRKVKSSAGEVYSSQETDLDTEGKKLGEDQLEYFEKSKVRDRNGRLQVVYHGGTVEFEFDTTRGGKGATQYGPGAYFTDSEYYAKEYTWYRGGDVKPYYLNIEKMFDDTNMDATVRMPQWKKLEQILRNNGIEEKFITRFADGGFAYMSRYLALKADGGAKTSGSWEGSEQLNSILREAGFDGIKGYLNDAYQYAIFAPNQAKLTTNEVPSTFYDTRYSTQETDNISNRHLLANAFEGITQNSEEYKLMQEYKGRVKILNEYEEKLAKLNAEIRKLTFGTDGERDSKKLKELQTEAKKVAGHINRHDKKLLSLEASEPLRKVIECERKKEAQKTKDHVKEIQQNKKARAEQTELRHKIRKAVRDLDKLLNRGNKKLNVKEDMKGFVSKALELADYLFTDHISNDELIRRGITVRMTPKEAALVKETEDILSKLYDQTDSLTDEEFTRLDAKRKSNLEKLRDLLTAQRNERLQTPVYELFNDLVSEYASLKNSKQDSVKAAYNEELENSLRAFISDDVRVKILKNMRVADMTTEELNWLYRAYTMVLTNVRNANKFHVNGMNATIEQVVGQIAGDFGSRKIPDKKMAIAVQKLVNKLGWDYEKLYYALDRIGSAAFTKLIMNIADSENTVMQDVMEAAAFRDEIVEKHGFNNWDVNKEIDKEFLDNTGKKFKMTLGQLMSLYAYSRREGAWDHIEYGGFVFGEAALTNPRPADSYKLSKEQCEAITSLLTKEQKGYVEDMQKFLSETMGAKGNEVSMLLYGIKMFGEKNYFPIHIAGQFKAQAQESQAKQAAGFGSMSNAGFTHEQNPNAKAPFVLEGFNEVWSDHVNEMSRYHGTVPALEDLRRVMNRSTYSDAVSESQSIKQLMENSFGKEAVEYFDNLYREANSGAIRDKLQNKSHKLLSLFRKNSVAYSLSVLIQQPASLVRAYDLIDRKHFGFKGFGTITSGVAKAVSDKWTKAHTNAYNEMLKYAPGVTMAKEIGGFDTATGGSIRSYLLDTSKSLKQKWKTGTAVEKGKAVLEIVDDNAVANLPNVADKIAWIEIWNACKRETVATHQDLVPNSDEFMKVVGDRFTEVIRATQVYDSIFAKSPMLKSKNLAVQYLVSFMNEPNTVANMAEKAVRDATKGDWKKGVRTGVVVIHSIIFTNMLKSVIYAMRDDDEDETYIEKYIEAIVGGVMDDFNALNYIPIARDAWSIAQGYDVERADMAIVSDAVDALGKVIKNANTDTDDMTEEELIEFDKKVTDANWKLVESLASFFGIPVKNIRREIEAVLDHARIASSNAGQTTAQSAWNKVYEAVVGSIPFMSNKNTKQDKLYDAIVSGDKDYIDRIKSTYKTDSAYQSAVRKALRENDPRIKDAAQARYEGNTEEYKSIFREIQKEGKFTFDDIMSAINTELSKLTPDKVTSDYTASGYVEAIAMGNTSMAWAMREDIIATKVANGKTQVEAEKEFVSAVATGIRDAYSSGLLDEAGAKNMLMEYTDKGEAEAVSKVSYWAFCEEHSEYDLSEANVNDYIEFAEPAKIPLDVFIKYSNGMKGLETKKDEWGDVEVTKREQVLEVIDSLPLTWEQKDALYLAAGYSESKIWDVPW